jgi:F0F1-type ATP synthase membrane subunit b/b'
MADVLAELYSAPREEFVARRTALAGSLRDEGRTEEAGEVAAAKKPTLPAYLANRLAHDRPREISALLNIAEKLAKAHGSGDAEKLRTAQRDLAEHVRELVAIAPEVAGRAVSESVGQRLAETLRAAASDPEAANLLRRGVLREEVETSGFEALVGVKLAAAKPRGRGASAKARAPRKSQREARSERVEKELSDARREVRSAESALAAAEREVARARKRVSDLEARLERR